MNWQESVSRIRRFVVKIETAQGHGTGFFCGYTVGGLCQIITAGQTIADAEKRGQPIKIFGHTFEKVALVEADQRVVIPGSWAGADWVVILCQAGELDFPRNFEPFFPPNEELDVGDEVFWAGFPDPAVNHLGFFCGHLSCRLPTQDGPAYLIDGVALPGVIGGPAFCYDVINDVRCIGALTAYTPDRATGKALTSLLVAEDLAAVDNVLEGIQSLDQARAEIAKIKSVLMSSSNSTTEKA